MGNQLFLLHYTTVATKLDGTFSMRKRSSREVRLLLFPKPQKKYVTDNVSGKRGRPMLNIFGISKN